MFSQCWAKKKSVSITIQQRFTAHLLRTRILCLEGCCKTGSDWKSWPLGFSLEESKAWTRLSITQTYLMWWQVQVLEFCLLVFQFLWLWKQVKGRDSSLGYGSSVPKNKNNIVLCSVWGVCSVWGAHTLSVKGQEVNKNCGL